MTRAALKRGLTDLFLARPILAIVINLLIAIAGIAALSSLI